MASSRPPGKDAAPASPRLRLDQALHDMTNALAAARAYSEVLATRVPAEDNAVVESLLLEIDRAGEIARIIRRGAYEDYVAGDVLECMRCGATFVHRKAHGRSASCRRCRSYEVTRWKP